MQFRWWGQVLGILAACSSPTRHGSGSDARSPDGAVIDGTAVDDGPADGDLADSAPDAVSDAMVDALPNADVPAAFECDPNAPPGPVTLHDLLATESVVVDDVNGTYISTTPVTANGDVVVMVPGCGSVILVLPPQAHYRPMVTYLRAGDDIWPDHPRTVHETYTAGPIKLFVDAPIAGNGPTYWISGPDRTVVSATEYDLRGSSLHPMTVLVRPTLASGAMRNDQYAVFPDVDFGTSGPLHIASWRPTTPHHVSVQLPFTSSNYSFSVGPQLRGEVYGGPSVSSSTPTNAIELDAPFPEVGTGSLAFMQLSDGDNGISISKALPATLPSTIAIDASTDLLPHITNITRDGDTLRPTISWTLTGGAIQPTSIFISGGSDQGISWRITVPAGLTSFRFPELPPSFALTYTLPWDPGLKLYQATDRPTYADARAVPSEVIYGGRIYPDGVSVRITSRNSP